MGVGTFSPSFDELEVESMKLSQVRKYVGMTAISMLCVMSASSPTALAEVPNMGLFSSNGESPSLAPMLESVTPAVVNIGVVRSERMPEVFQFFGQSGEPPVRRSRGAGSGVVVDAEQGYIISNHHVVANADNITVGLQDGRVFEAELIGSDEMTDVALLKIDAERLTALPFADAENLRVGDYVVAIGNPFGIGQTVTQGIISALGRAGINNENYEDFIQTDAAINVGNSGGALVDLHGRLVGINTAIISGSGTNSGVGFAVPVDMVSAVMDHLERDGEVRRGQLGVIIRDHTPVLEEGLGLGAAEGALITQVAPGSAADRAGLKVSDLVIGIEGEEVSSSRDLRNAIGLAGVGRDLRLNILRDGREMEVVATILGDDNSSNVADNGEDRTERNLQDPRFFGAVLEETNNGIMIGNLDNRSRAAAAGLRPGDQILAINRQSVESLADVNQILNEDPSVIALNVQRDDQQMLLILP